MHQGQTASNVVQLVTAAQVLDRSLGWEIVAGQDVQTQRRITRYMLVINKDESMKDRAVILSTKNTRTDWQIHTRGKPIAMVKLFDTLDQNNELR